MKVGFIIVALAILFSLNGYVMLRGWQSLPNSSYIRPIFLITAIVLFICMFAGMIFGNSMPPTLAKSVSFIGYSYIIIFIYLFVSFLLVDLVRIVNFFIGFAPAGMAAFRQWIMMITLGTTAIAMIH